MKKILLILTLIMYAVAVYAQDFLNPEKRTRENPQVHSLDVLRNMEEDPSIIERALETPYLKAELKVYDFTNELSPYQIDKMRERCRKFVDDNDCDIMIAFVSKPDWTDYDNEEYCMDLYDYNDFGVGEKYDGVHVVINLATHRFAIFDSGTPSELRIAGNNLRELERAMQGPFRENDYAQGVIKFADKYEGYLSCIKMKTTGYPFSRKEERTPENLLVANNYAREAMKYPGVMKEILNTPAVVPDYYIYDFSKRLSEPEYSEQREICRKFAERHEFDFAFMIVDQYGWSDDYLTKILDNLCFYNDFEVESKKCLYLIHNIANRSMSLKSSQMLHPILFKDKDLFWDNIERIYNKFNIYEYIPHLVDYLDAILYEQPMVKDGLDIEQRIKAELNKGSRLIDISGTMDYQDGDTINSTCLRNSKQGNRDYYVVSVLIPSANSSEIEKLGRRIGGMIGGGSKCLLVVNQYNQEYVFLEDDASRHTPNNEETQYISYLKYDNFFKSGVSISDMIDRYNYVTMSKGERALAFLGNQDPFEPFCTFIPIALIVSLIVLAIVSHRKFGVKEAMGARHYVINGSFAVTHKKKTKGEVSVSTVYVPPSSSGGGSRRGSSGRSHSGGSGGW